MNDTPPLDNDELMRRISRDIADSYDEELEMEDRGRLTTFRGRRRRGAAAKGPPPPISRSCSACRPSW